jgi:hypothetical protein
MNPQKEASAIAAKVHLLDKALERNDPYFVNDRRRDPRRPQGRRQFPRKNRAKPAKEKKGNPIRAGKISKNAERHGRGRDNPKGWLAIGVKIKDDPRAGRDRQPKKRPAKRHLRLEGASENPRGCVKTPVEL